PSMFPGPVFHRELVTTSRRGRYYAIRAVYGLALLGVVGGQYSARFEAMPLDASMVTIEARARFAAETIGYLSLAQQAGIFLLTPALVAGVVADEKRRKTLHYLLASQLSSGEIVVGKLASRVWFLLVFALIGLPLFVFLTLFGGGETTPIVLAFGG